jgi:hypothetical protein
LSLRPLGLHTIVNFYAINSRMRPSENARPRDEKLWQILGQIGRLRSRLNWLALQHAFFYAAAALIVAGALIFLSAFMLSPINFIAVTVTLSILAAFAIVAAVRQGWLMRTNAQRAAVLADERAGLKGRLATIVTIAEHRKKGAMWSYLVEDTLSRRAEFAPAKIQKRRVSPALYAFIASLIVAAMVWPISRIHHAIPVPASNGQDDLTLDLNDLHLRPAEPGDDNAMAVQADPETMRRLEDKLAREGVEPGQGASTSLGKLMDQARNVAGNLQDKLTGQEQQHQRLNLKLADAADPMTGRANHNPLDAANHKRRDAAGQFQRDQAGDNSGPLPRGSLHNNNSDEQEQAAGRSDLANPQQGGNDPNAVPKPLDDQGDQQSDQGSSGGAAHGIGVDPDSLFGAPTPSKLGNEGFEIAIEARPMDHGAKGAGHAYEPPKVRTPLAASQEPDEPVARTDVPPDDRTTIKRVFER